MPADPDAEILLEITTLGGAQQVRAVSGSDGLEVAFVAPIHAPKGEIERLARAKLAYVRRSGSRGGGQGPDRGGSGGGGRGGIVI